MAGERGEPGTDRIDSERGESSKKWESVRERRGARQREVGRGGSVGEDGMGAGDKSELAS